MLEARVVVVPTLLTTWDSTLDVEPVKLASPPYTAVMLWVPMASAEVVYVAILLLKVPVPREVLPFLKVTVPVGVPAPGEAAATVAVKVTDWL